MTETDQETLDILQGMKNHMHEAFKGIQALLVIDASNKAVESQRMVAEDSREKSLMIEKHKAIQGVFRESAQSLKDISDVVNSVVDERSSMIEQGALPRAGHLEARLAVYNALRQKPTF